MKINDVKKEILKKNPAIELIVKKDLAFQVGRMLTNARLMQGMTQEKLAKLIGTKQPAIARVENGASLPNLSFLKKIAEKAFRSYLIPPRFAFMKEEDAFTMDLINRGVKIKSGTSLVNHPEPNNIPAYFTLSHGAGLLELKEH
ncbi:MAG: helix-turn-helix domain-containing protein [bacterium]|nr:helix-turn-helix domain-containing protein [bacterium]